ncbi:hypothetical protein KCU65_g300, partial [Aureobasidium melanogenum]
MFLVVCGDAIRSSLETHCCPLSPEIVYIYIGLRTSLCRVPSVGVSHAVVQSVIGPGDSSSLVGEHKAKASERSQGERTSQQLAVILDLVFRTKLREECLLWSNNIDSFRHGKSLAQICALTKTGPGSAYNHCTDKLRANEGIKISHHAIGVACELDLTTGPMYMF